MSFTTQIQTSNSYDSSRIQRILTEKGINFKLNSDTRNLECDENYELFLGDLSHIFQNEYILKENLEIGHVDIRITINGYQDPFTCDDWGRRINSVGIESSVYFISRFQPEENLEITTISLGERFFTLGLVKAIDRLTERSGYVVYGFPKGAAASKTITTTKGGFLVDGELFESKEVALEQTVETIKNETT